MSLDPITAGIDLAKGLIDRVWPDASKKIEFEQKIAELQANGELQKMAAEFDLAKQQIAVNVEEAKSEKVFVSGWRPFIGWVCGGAYAYHFILQPLLAFVLAALGVVVALPTFNMDALSTVMFGMLGLGVYRSAEKIADKVVSVKKK